MDLEIETFKRRDRHAAVAAYVRERSDGAQWEEWLQTNRVELNMMTTPQFQAWLDAKIAEQDSVKVVPPSEILYTAAREQVTKHIRQVITDRILEEAKIEEQVQDAVRRVNIPPGEDLTKSVWEWLSENEEAHWQDYMKKVAA